MLVLLPAILSPACSHCLKPIFPVVLHDLYDVYLHRYQTEAVNCHHCSRKFAIIDTVYVSSRYIQYSFFLMLGCLDHSNILKHRTLEGRVLLLLKTDQNLQWV